MKELSRRELLNRMAGAAGAATVGLAGSGIADPGQAGGATAARKLKVVVAGAHPDKVEIGCGGTIARYTELGHEVVAIYLTRGERGEPPRSYEETGKIREAESRQACAILNARPVFVGQVNGRVEVTYARYDEFRKILLAEKPDVVFTHWALDRHEDQRATLSFVYDAWLQSGRKFGLYFYEVLTGQFTLQFAPTHYVDITSTEARKREACYCHVSKDMKVLYQEIQEISRFRGRECGRQHAEGFIRHIESPEGMLPFAV